MGKKSLVGGLTIVLMLTAASVAVAKPKPSRPFTATSLGATVSSTGQLPAPGSNSVQAATLTSSLGNGAATTKTSFAAGSSSTTFTFTGTTTFFTPHGSFRSTVSGTGIVTPGATVMISFNGSGKILGGTGRYAGASGKYTITGTTSPNQPVKLSLKGTISY